MIRKITCFSIQKNLPQYLGEQWIPKKSGLWWVHLTESFQKFWSDFFFFNWVLFSILFNLKLESTGNYESTFFFFFKYFSQDVCRFSGSRMAIYFIATQELSICTHARSIFTRTLSIARHILSIAASLQLGKKKKTAMAQWKQALFWFFLYALKSLNTGLGNCLNIRIIDVKDSLKFTLHKFYNPPSTTLHSCFFCSFLIVLHCFIITLRKYYPAQQKLYNWNNVTVSICLQFLFLSRLISVRDLSANEAISIQVTFFNTHSNYRLTLQ